MVDFEGGEITSDAGLLLIRQADDRLGLVKGMAKCIDDKRDSRYIEHEMETMLRQRIYQIKEALPDVEIINHVHSFLIRFCLYTENL